MPDDQKQLNVRIDEEAMRVLKMLAAKKGITLQALAQEMVGEFISGQDKETAKWIRSMARS